MMILPRSLLALFLLAPSLCEALFPANVSSYINVQVPVQLHEHNVSGGLLHRAAKFGKHYDLWQEEGRLVALTHFAQGNLCQMPGPNVTRTFGRSPYFLLAEMGACSPTKKARYAQDLGAAGLILESVHCVCSENCTEEAHCIEELPHLHDDGTGNSIVIPTMIIGKGKSKHIQAELRKGDAVLMEMAWHYPKVEETATVDFWYSPMHVSSEEFLSNFSALADSLKDRLDFQPHHHVMDGEHLQCHQHADDPDSPCYNMCTNNGRYCSLNGGYNHHGITGKAVVTESLRRMCLLKHHDISGFWHYVKHFKALCQSNDYFADENCIKDALKQSNIKEDDINGCMKDSGDITKDNTNTLLAQAAADSENLLEAPVIHINGLPMKYPLSTKFVFESYCMGFETGKAPEACFKCGSCGNPAACASRSPMHCDSHDGQFPEPSKQSTKKSKKGSRFGHFVLVTFILTGIGGFVYYKKYMEDEDRPSYGGYSLGEALMSDGA